MAKKDMLEAKLGWLKLLFSILIVTGFSLLGWIVLNYTKQSHTVVMLCLLAILSLMVAIAVVINWALDLMKQLEEV